MASKSYPNPVAGRIQAYEEAWDGSSFRVTNPSSNHNPPGIDLGNGRSGDPIYAMAAGTIVELRPTVDGVMTIQAADGTRIVYAHMERITAHMGMPVGLGAIIGYHDSVGNVSGPHLHLQVSDGGTHWVDPWPLLAQNQEEAMPTIEALEGYCPGSKIYFDAGKQYQFFAFEGGARVSWAWTPPSVTNADTEALVDLTGEGPAHYIPKIYDGARYRYNAYLPTSYAQVTPPPAPEPPEPEPAPEPPGVLVGRTLVGLGVFLVGLAALIAAIGSILPPA